MNPQPFLHDFRPSAIRSPNWDKLIPTRELTDKRIEQYILQGKYGPALQQKHAARIANQHNLVSIRKQGKKTLSKLLSQLGY